MKKIKILAILLCITMITTSCSSTHIEDFKSIEVEMTPPEDNIVTDDTIQDVSTLELDNLDALSSQYRDLESILDLITVENEASKLEDDEIEEDIPIRDFNEVIAPTTTNLNIATSPTQNDVVVEDTTQNDVVVEDTTQDDVVVEDTTQDDVVVEDTTQDDVVVEDTTQDDVVAEDTTQGDVVVEDTTQDDIVVEDTTQDDVVVEDTTQDDVVVEDTTQDDVVVEDTTQDDVVVEDTTQNDVVVEDTTQNDVVVEDTTQNDVVVENTTTDSSNSNSNSNTTQTPATNQSEMRGVWISFLELQSFKGSSQSAFTSKVSGYFDTCVNMGLNTVIVQVRPHGDSIYPSEYYPWSQSVSGTMGVALSYDPLEIMISEAKKRGLSFHAWVNPYRTMTNTEMALIPDTYQVKQWYNSANRSDYMVQTGTDSRWWLKPSNAEARQLIVNGVAEIVRKYDVDGIHFDDYFYGADPSVYGDTSAQAKQYNSLMVKATYDAIKSINPTVQFGISPLGSFSANSTLPSSDTGYLSTDLKLWCQTSGYIDYVMPQIYWQYAHSTQPFTTVFNNWQNFVTASSVDLYIGLAPYKPEVEVEQQIIDIQNSYNGDGYCLYRYDYIHGLNL